MGPMKRYGQGRSHRSPFVSIARWQGERPADGTVKARLYHNKNILTISRTGCGEYSHIHLDRPTSYSRESTSSVSLSLSLSRYYLQKTKDRLPEVEQNAYVTQPVSSFLRFFFPQRGSAARPFDERAYTGDIALLLEESSLLIFLSVVLDFRGSFDLETS